MRGLCSLSVRLCVGGGGVEFVFVWGLHQGALQLVDKRNKVWNLCGGSQLVCLQPVSVLAGAMCETGVGGSFRGLCTLAVCLQGDSVKFVGVRKPVPVCTCLHSCKCVG